MIPIRSAIIELLPCAIFANGPACIIAGVLSSVCTRFGFIASFIITATLPATFRSPIVTGLPSVLYATTVLATRAFRSCKSLASASIAIISEATVMSNLVSLSIPNSFGSLLSPIRTLRSARSLTSRTLGHIILSGSILSLFPLRRWLSIIAATRLCDAVIACISPVKFRLNSSIGITCAYPPPAAPPFMPNVGPIDGCLIAITLFLPILCIACPSPTVVVVLPSPSGVGVIADTTMYLAFGRSCNLLRTDKSILAIYLPY